MTSPIVIEPARAADFAGVLDLLRHNRLPPDDLERHLATTLVARSDGAVVGSAALELYGAAALLRSVAVASDLRGHGLGARLTEAALDLARARGVRTVYLLTTTAADFFPRFGFNRIDRAQVEGEVRRSVEFTTACPDSAHVMARQI
jgi:amino-acid N-acetyltransferase